MNPGDIVHIVSFGGVPQVHHPCYTMCEGVGDEDGRTLDHYRLRLLTGGYGEWSRAGRDSSSFYLPIRGPGANSEWCVITTPEQFDAFYAAQAQWALLDGTN